MSVATERSVRRPAAGSDAAVDRAGAVALLQGASGGLRGLVAGAPVDVSFGPGGGTVALRISLTGPPTAPAADGTSTLDVALDRVTLTVTPLDHELTVPVPQATTKALTVELGGDQEVRRVRVVGLALPRSGSTFYRFDQGGVSVETPPADDEENPTWKSVRAVLSAGPSGGPTLPTRGFPGFGPPDDAGLYGDQLPGGTTSGGPAQLTLDCGSPVRAGRLELRFCTDDGGVLDLDPVTFAARAEVVRSAPPRGLRLTVGPADGPVLAWQHDPPLTTPDTVELVPVLGGLLAEALSSGAGPAAETSAGQAGSQTSPASGPVTVDAELVCASEARVRLVLGTRGVVRTLTLHGRTPARAPLAGVGAELPAGIPAEAAPGTPPDAVTARLTGSAGPVRRTDASPSPLDDVAGTGEVVSGTRQVARRITPDLLEGRPLVRIGFPAASVAGEVVVELRADAGGPGPVLARGGIAAVPTCGRPRWRTVEVAPLSPESVPAAGCWVVLRASTGALLWADAVASADAGRDLAVPPGVMVSEDGGTSWRPSSAAWPGLSLFVDDPHGAVPALRARAGDVTGTLLVAPGDGFDDVFAWPPGLRGALQGAATVRLDCARDLELEVADLTAGWTAGLDLRAVS